MNITNFCSYYFTSNSLDVVLIYKWLNSSWTNATNGMFSQREQILKKSYSWGIRWHDATIPHSSEKKKNQTFKVHDKRIKESMLLMCDIQYRKALKNNKVRNKKVTKIYYTCIKLATTLINLSKLSLMFPLKSSTTEINIK